MSSDEPIADVTERDITLVGFAFGLMILSVCMLVVCLVLTINVAHKADVVYNAECVFRNNIQQQVVDSEHFLSLHPNGIPGINASEIQQSIAREKITVDSLAGLNCPITGG